jgi:predicted peptidase
MKYLIILLSIIITLETSAQSKREFKSFDFQGEKITYAIQLPTNYDPEKAYPVALGPSEVKNKDDQSYYWRGVKDSYGWILLDFPIYEGKKDAVAAFLNHIRANYPVEGNKFHAICFSANSSRIFDLVMNMAEDFHSITGMAGNPGNRTEQFSKLKNVKVRFVVGDKDTYWMNAAKDRHAKLLDAGVDSQIEIIKDGKHVLTELIGEGVLTRMEKLRVK